MNDGKSWSTREKPRYKNGAVFYSIAFEKQVKVMPRKRKYQSNADKQAAYRERKREIIAVDGEGYTAYGEHTYASLFAFDGKELYELHAIDYGLSLSKILRFIRDIAVQKPNAIWISFSFSYDVTMMFKVLKAEEIDKMINGGVYLADYGVYVEYRYRKQLRIVFNKQLTVTIYDLFGFTGTSFVNTMAIFDVTEEIDTVREGKALRGDLEAYDIDRIRRYTQAELASLIKVFQRILHYAQGAGLSLTRYEGAGSVASALFRAHGYTGKIAKEMAIKTDKDEDIEIVFDRLYRAYYGGRIETHKYGYVRGVHGYDIVSAYPGVTVRLPDIRYGVFRYRKNPDRRFINGLIDNHDYGVITLRYNLPDNYFYPFPYRDRLSVYYPQQGYSSVYLPLFRVALQHIPDLWDYITVDDIVWLDCQQYRFPFEWVIDVFKRRNELKQAGDPAQLMLKLGLNSLYGKFAQKPIRQKNKVMKGTYENIFFAGYITASTQARLLEAAYQLPETVIAMTTDGIYTTEPLPIDTGKDLGQWEKEEWREGIFVYSGFYILRTGEKVKYRSRGLHIKNPEAVFQQILEKWKEKARDTRIPMTIYHSIRRKKKDDDVVGYFEEIEKIIDLTGGAGKRVSLYNGEPYKELCETLAVGYDYFYHTLADKPRSAQFTAEEAETEDL